jgi:hypothetical protein
VKSLPQLLIKFNLVPVSSANTEDEVLKLLF